MASEKGFTLIEVLVSVGLISVVFMGLSTLLGYYGMRLTELRSEQELRIDAGKILKSFSTTESCNRQIKNLVGALPSSLKTLEYNFKTVELDGAHVSTSGPFPGRPYGKLEAVRMKVEGVPLPGQMVLRARIAVDFRRLSSVDPNYPNVNPLRTRTSSVYFKLDPLGRVTGCLDDKAYKHTEWSERICTRMAGQWKNDFKCDLSRSEVARRAGCKALGLSFSGGACEI